MFRDTDGFVFQHSHCVLVFCYFAVCCNFCLFCCLCLHFAFATGICPCTLGLRTSRISNVISSSMRPVTALVWLDTTSPVSAAWSACSKEKCTLWHLHLLVHLSVHLCICAFVCAFEHFVVHCVHLEHLTDIEHLFAIQDRCQSTVAFAFVLCIYFACGPFEPFG